MRCIAKISIKEETLISIHQYKDITCIFHLFFMNTVINLDNLLQDSSMDFLIEIYLKMF